MADTPEFKLSSETHKQVFEQNILNNSEIVKPFATAQKHPKAVVLAGQPGAGKGTLAGKVRDEFQKNITTIDPDRLREEYPNVDVLQKYLPYTWSDVTHEDASAWSKELRAEMIAQRKNILIDGTNPKPEVIAQLKNAGYEVEIRVVATHRVESTLGVEKRYMDKLEEDGFGRYVPPRIQEPIYNELPSSLDKVREQFPDVRMRIYDRDGVSHYDSFQNIDTKPSIALTQARDKTLTTEKLQDLSQDYERSITQGQNLPQILNDNPKINNALIDNHIQERATLHAQSYLEQTGKDVQHHIQLKSTASHLHNPQIQTIGDIPRTELAQLNDQLIKKHGYAPQQALEVVQARIDVQKAVQYGMDHNGELPHAAEHKRSHAVLRDTTLVLGDHPMTLKLHRQVSAYNLFANGGTPDFAVHILGPDAVVQSPTNSQSQTQPEAPKTNHVQNHPQPDTPKTTHVQNHPQPDTPKTTHVQNHPQPEAPKTTHVQNHPNHVAPKTAHVQNRPHIDAPKTDHVQNRPHVNAPSNHDVSTHSTTRTAAHPTPSNAVPKNAVPKNALHTGAKALGVVGAGIEIGLGVADVAHAVDRANTNREQHIKGWEAATNAAGKSAVTGGAGALGGLGGGIAGSYVTPVVGTIGGAVAGGAAAAEVAGNAYEGSSSQKLVKQAGRLAGEVSYDYLSEEGRLNRKKEELKQQIQDEHHPDKKKTLHQQLERTTKQFETVATKNTAEITAKKDLDERYPELQNKTPKVSKSEIRWELAKSLEAGYGGKEAVNHAHQNAEAKKYGSQGQLADIIRYGGDKSYFQDSNKQKIPNPNPIEGQYSIKGGMSKFPQKEFSFEARYRPTNQAEGRMSRAPQTQKSLKDRLTSTQPKENRMSQPTQKSTKQKMAEDQKLSHKKNKMKAKYPNSPMWNPKGFQKQKGVLEQHGVHPFKPFSVLDNIHGAQSNPPKLKFGCSANDPEQHPLYKAIDAHAKRLLAEYGQDYIHGGRELTLALLATAAQANMTDVSQIRIENGQFVLTSANAVQTAAAGNANNNPSHPNGEVRIPTHDAWGVPAETSLARIDAAAAATAATTEAAMIATTKASVDTTLRAESTENIGQSSRTQTGATLSITALYDAQMAAQAITQSAAQTTPQTTPQTTTSPPAQIALTDHPLHDRLEYVLKHYFEKTGRPYDNGGNEAKMALLAAADQGGFKAITGIGFDKGQFLVVDNSNPVIPSLIKMDASIALNTPVTKSEEQFIQQHSERQAQKEQQMLADNQKSAEGASASLDQSGEIAQRRRMG